MGYRLEMSDHLDQLKEHLFRTVHSRKGMRRPFLQCFIRSSAVGHLHYYPKVAILRSFASSRHHSTLCSDQLPETYSQKKTIYALSTPAGRGGVAVIRVSGPNSKDVFEKMVKPFQDSSSLVGRKKVTHHENNTRLELIPWKMQRCTVVDPSQPSLFTTSIQSPCSGY